MKENKKIKVVLTGGHAGSTAYAVIEELRSKKDFIWDIYFIGAKFAIEGTNIKTLEEQVLSKIGVNFLSLYSGRIQRRFTFWTIPSIAKIPLGVIQAFYYLITIKPKFILSFGGYSAFPVCFAGWLIGIPVFIHEQTCAAGRANLLSAFFAKKIFLSRQESTGYFPKNKTIVIGNPISRKIIKINPKKFLSNPPVLLITGGARGSESINDNIEKIIKKLLQGYYVIHQVGQYQYKKFARIRSRMSEKNKYRYKVYSLIPSWYWYKFIRKADIIVSRAGANIVSEIIQTKRPSLLIPLSFAYKSEQYKNAQFANKFGFVKIIEENELNPDNLMSEITNLKDNWKKIVSEAVMETPDKKASSKLVNFLIRYLNEKI